jgi:hypothetical protein
VIVERFDFALPHNMAGGRYPIMLQMRNLSLNEDSGPLLDLGEIIVGEQPFPGRTDHLLANFRQRIGLVSALASQGSNRRSAPWTEPLVVEPGEIIHLTLEWQSLALPEDSYTIFVHLIDPANHPWATLDYTPLGGSTPTHLWIPKWLPGQRMLDPYQVKIRADLPPGTYYLEVGLYEMTSHRRLHRSDRDGNLNGDRFILGAVEIKD